MPQPAPIIFGANVHPSESRLKKELTGWSSEPGILRSWGNRVASKVCMLGFDLGRKVPLGPVGGGVYRRARAGPSQGRPYLEILKMLLSSAAGGPKTTISQTKVITFQSGLSFLVSPVTPRKTSVCLCLSLLLLLRFLSTQCWLTWPKQG